MNIIKYFLRDETGMELSEYAVAAGLIALAVSAAFTSLGTQINKTINVLTDSIPTTGKPIAN